MLRPTSIPPALIVACLIQGGTAHASELVRRSPAELARKLPRCAVVKVVSTETRPVRKYGGNPFTFTKLRVVKRAWGDLPSEFSLRLFGGRLGGVSVETSIIPRFRAGEQLVLMLGPDNQDGFPVLEVQGVYRLRPDERSGRLVLAAPVAGLELLSAKDGSKYLGSPTEVPVEDFLYSLKAVRSVKTERR